MVRIEAHPLDVVVLLELHVEAVPPRGAAGLGLLDGEEFTLGTQLIGPLRYLDARKRDAFGDVILYGLQIVVDDRLRDAIGFALVWILERAACQTGGGRDE
jgi:hypothetical protein